MRTKLFCFLYLPVLLLAACGAPPPPEEVTTRIDWDKWGVPHITADNIDGLFYAQGWAQMHNHANLVLQLYGASRGRGAEYWGREKLSDDMLIHTLGFDELADEWEKQQDLEIKTIYQTFVRGLNDYAEAHPEAISEENRVVLPLTVKDVNMHSMYVVFSRFIAGQELYSVTRWPDMGSNAWAVAPSRSASGSAMLVQNPHLPWYRELLFFESHLNLAGKNMYGATLVGFPGIAIGFNEHLGWSHTNNVIDNADLYELQLQDGGYLLDGERKEFETRAKTIKIKQEDGSLAEQEITIAKSVHGPVIKQTKGQALALRMVGTDRPNVMLQWWRMINSSSFGEFESALKMAQIPFWNVMYADKAGNIFYLFNGLVPQRSSGDWNYWNRIIPGGKSADVWTGVHPYSDLPKLKNPETGWLQNANDPPWTSTIPAALDPEDFAPYMSDRGMAFRPQRSARMLAEDESITFEELMEYKHSTRLELADRLLDDLFAAVDAHGSEKAKAAKAVLQAWDRESDTDSRGTLLFYNWAMAMNLNNPANFATPWNPAEPMATPDGLAEPRKAAQVLEQVATELEEKYGSMDIPWGDFYRLTYNGKDLPANGMDGSFGVFRVTWPGDGDGDRQFAGGGDSWVGAIEFGDQVKARVLLSYGNATQPDSPHNGDQMELYSKKELREAWFYPEAVQTNTVKTEILTEKGFEVMKK